jgi:hypothetical protein
MRSDTAFQKEVTMSKRFWVSVGVLAAVIAIVSIAAIPLAGQAKPSTPAAPAAKSYTPPKTPWGHPDLQGIYTSDDYINVPLERPVEFGERFLLTDKEVADRDAQIANQAKADLQRDVAPNQRVTTGPPGHWGERARRSPRQTSRIVDPPDGRMPPLTPLGQKRQRETQAVRQAPADSWENFSYYIRCISRGVTGSIFPVIYGNGAQIIQSPDYVAILHEMVHEARIIPLNKTPHGGSGIRNYMGDSRGRWEGNTLVVETTNFVDGKVGIGQGGPTPTSDALHLVERFTRTDPITIQYEVTIEDPKIFTRPWKVTFPIVQEPGYQNFEYACHEGNYAMTNSLSGARADEKAAGAAQQR